MDERRKFKHSNDDHRKSRCRDLRNQIKKKCKLTKEEWFAERWAEVEKSMLIVKINEPYRTIKRSIGLNSARPNNVLNKYGMPLYKTEDKVNRWVKYIEELYSSNGSENDLIEKEDKVNEDEKGDIIFRSEFDRRLKDFSNRKAPRIDGILVELLRSARGEVLDSLFKLVGDIHESGKLRVPTDFRKSIAVMMLKKNGA